MADKQQGPIKGKNVPFIPYDELGAQVMTNLESGYASSLSPQRPHGRKAIIVAGAPSVAGFYDHLRHLTKDPECDIIAINGMMGVLKREKIPYKYAVMVDPRIKHLKHVRKASNGVTYWMATQCHPKVFQKLKDHDLWMFSIDSRFELGIVGAWHAKYRKDFILARTGSTAGLAAWTIAYSQGYRDFHMFGFDSCLASDGSHHVYENTIKDVFETEICGHKFLITPWMMHQLNDFETMFSVYRPTSTITFYGFGMLQAAWENLEGQWADYPWLPHGTFTTMRNLRGALEQKGLIN